VRSGDGASVVASEPFDDDPAWVTLPDCSVVEATAEAVSVTPLALTERHRH
jgi:glutamine amidotransferase